MTCRAYHTVGPALVLVLEVIERAAGASAVYYLPALLMQAGLSEHQATSATGVLVGLIYLLCPIATLVAGNAPRLLLLSASLMLVGMLAMNQHTVTAIGVGSVLYAIGAAGWKGHVVGAFGTFKASVPGHLHLAISLGSLIGLPLFGRLFLHGPKVFLLGAALAIGVVFVGCLFLARIPADNRPSALQRIRQERKGRLLIRYLGLLPLWTLLYYPFLSASASSIAIAVKLNLNSGTFMITLLTADCLVAAFVKPSRISIIGSLASALLGLSLLTLIKPALLSLMLAHVLFGVADALFHLYIYARAMRSRFENTLIWFLLALTQVLQSVTAKADRTLFTTVALLIAPAGIALYAVLRDDATQEGRA